jgi:predicted GTPase
MSRWRIAVLTVLFALPVVVLLCLGSYFLWQSGWGFYAWWPMGGCLALGYILAWYWHRKQQLLHRIDFTPNMHWTERDRQAWQLVERRAQGIGKVGLTQLGDLQFYVTTAQDMALEMARFYHPDAPDPLSFLTIPEILAVIELASHDLAEMVEENLPGGHLLTIKDWIWARKAAETATNWYQKFSAAYWIVSAVFTPVQTGLRYAATQAGMARPWELFQKDLIAWLTTAFIHRLGTYLIEVNSGRLRVGAHRYQELMREHQALAPPAPDDRAGARSGQPTESARTVKLTIMGQVKMGKSSFINALLGEQRAHTDVLPATSEVTQYDLKPKDVPVELTLFDTVGYSHTGPRADQLRATEQAAQQSDLLILVLHARNPARQADLELLRALKGWFESRADLRMPPIVAVVTHIDLLSPAMEWAPPYDWLEPRRPKEQQIQQAVAAVGEQLSDYLAGAVPVCAAPGKVYGIEEWFLPVLTDLLDEAHAVALLRCLRAEANADRVRKVFEQFLAVGRRAALLMLERPRK